MSWKISKVRHILASLILSVCLSPALYSQGVFESNVSPSGNWNDSGNWTLVSGSDADGIPDANDDVTILSGDQINIAAAGTTSVDDLTITGTLNFPSNGRTLSVGGNLTMTGTSTVTGNNSNRNLSVTGNFNVSSGATATISGQRVTITGATTLDGELSFTSATGDKTFGTIDVNASGHWNNNSAEDFVINGNIINDGSWTGCNGNGCIYDFTSSSGAISGSSTVTIADFQVNSPGSITNNGTVLLTDDLTGTGTLTNGATGDFQIQGTGPFTLSTVDFSTAGNTVTYTNTGNTTLITTTYDNLVVSKAVGTRAQVASTFTVNNDITITSGEFRLNSGTLSVSGDILVQGGEFSPNNAAAICNITGDLNITSGEIDYNNSTTTVTGSLLISGGTSDFNRGTFTTGAITVDNGETVSFGGVTLVVNGPTTANGTLTTRANGGDKTFDDITVSSTGNWNVTATESFTVNGDIDVDGTWTGCSSTTGCVYTLTKTGGTLRGSSSLSFSDVSITSPASYTSSTNVTITDELIGTGSYTNANGSTLELSGAGPFSITTLDATAVSNTVTYSGGSSLTINGATYHDLIINKTGGTGTISSAVTVNNDLSVQGGVLAVDATTLAVTNDLILTGGEFTPNDALAVVNIGGDLTMWGASTLYDQNNGDVNLTGSFTVNDGLLTMDGSGSTFDVGGTYLVSGGLNDFNAGAFSTGVLTVDNGQTLNMGGASFTVTGATTANGTITVDNNGGTKTLNDLTISGTGNWNVASQESFTINGDIISNGTWTGCSNTTSCIYDLTSSSGTITGSTDVTFADLNIDAPGSYTNSQDIIITDELTGTGSYTNAAGSTLEFSGDGPLSISTFNASANANTVTFSGGSGITVNPGDYYNLLFDKTGGTATINGTTNVLNDLTIQNAGAVAINAATLTVTNNLALSGAELTPNNDNAVLNVGGDLSMASGLFDHNNGDVTVTGDFNVTGGIMTVNQGSSTSTFNVNDFNITTATVTLSEGEFNVNNASGGLTVNSGSFTIGGTALVLAGDYDVNGGTNDLNGGSLSAVDINIASGQTVLMGDASVTSTGNTTVDGTLTTDDTGGTKSLGNVVVNGTGAWNVTAGESFTISGDIMNNGSWTGCSNTSCNYMLTKTSGVISGANPVDMSDVIIDAPASYTNNVDLTVADRITGSGTFTQGVGSSLEYAGNNSGGGNFNITNFNASATGNTVTYSRAGDQRLRATTDPDNNYYNVVISTTAAGNDVTMVSDITIDNQLTLTTGDVFLGANRLTMADGATIIGGNANSFISLNGSGVLRQNYSAAGATLSLPVGDVNDYSPITAFTINSGTFGAGAYVEFDITDADHPNRNTDNTAAGGDDDGTAAVAYISRYWTLTGNNISDFNFNATYVYDDLDVTGTEANMAGTLYRTPPGEAFLDWSVEGTVNPVTNSVTVSGEEAFGDLYAMDNTLNRLPIVLLSFEAEASESSVLLEWVTASEENNDFFTIERSLDGDKFESLLIQPGAGSSNGQLKYQAKDGNPIIGTAFYRLKQTDFNGQFSYSEIKSVVFKRLVLNKQLVIYPNPVRPGGVLTIRHDGAFSSLENLTVVLIDISGETVFNRSIKPQSNTPLVINISNTIKKGLYVLRVTNSSVSLQERLVVN